MTAARPLRYPERCHTIQEALSMRDDLLDAHAAVDWAVSQIPLIQNAFFDWCKEHPYKLVREPDSQRGGYVLVAYPSGTFPLINNAWVGAIVNSIRSSLDSLAAALARRNGKNPSADTHFPIFASEQCMIDPLEGIEGKKWLSNGERTAIKALMPYKEGDDTIWPLHQLDILRKHERLISASVDVRGFRWESGHIGGAGGYMMVGGLAGIERLKDKIILCGAGGSSLDVTKSHAHISAHITFDEFAIGLADHEVAATLSRFATRVDEIIKLFDS
jgi:hypothetical protein